MKLESSSTFNEDFSKKKHVFSGTRHWYAAKADQNSPLYIILALDTTYPHLSGLMRGVACASFLSRHRNLDAFIYAVTLLLDLHIACSLFASGNVNI